MYNSNSANTMMYRNSNFVFFFAHENLKKPLSKVGCFSKIAEIKCRPTKNKSKSQIIFHENSSLQDVYTMTLRGGEGESCFHLATE